MVILVFFFFKQKTAYEMRISDWSSDVCSSDLLGRVVLAVQTALAEVGDVPGLLGDPEREAILAALAECEVAMTEAGHADPVNAARERLDIGRATGRERGCQYV